MRAASHVPPEMHEDPHRACAERRNSANAHKKTAPRLEAPARLSHLKSCAVVSAQPSRSPSEFLSSSSSPNCDELVPDVDAPARTLPKRPARMSKSARFVWPS